MVLVSFNIEEFYLSEKIDFSSASLFYRSAVEPCLRRTVFLFATNKNPLTHYLFNYLRLTKVFYSTFNELALIVLKIRNVTDAKTKRINLQIIEGHACVYMHHKYFKS